MADLLKIEPTYKSPLIICDAEKGSIEIKGRSLPENTASIYDPLLQWLSDYASHPSPSTQVVIQLEYFNTSSSKVLLEVFKILEKIKNAGYNVSLKWYYEEDDPDMKEQGELFIKLTGLPIELIGVEEFNFDFL